MEQQNAAGAPAKRPTFLTVLCILSFIAQGFAIIGYILLIAAMGAATAVVSATDDMMSDMSDSLGMSMGDSSVSDAIASSGPSVGMTWAYLVVGFICVIINLMGVIRMWKLKKSGFFMYTGGTVISLIMGIVYNGTTGLVMSLVIGGAFIVMYGLNLKHMS